MAPRYRKIRHSRFRVRHFSKKLAHHFSWRAYWRGVTPPELLAIAAQQYLDRNPIKGEAKRLSAVRGKMPPRSYTPADRKTLNVRVPLKILKKIQAGVKARKHEVTGTPLTLDDYLMAAEEVYLDAPKKVKKAAVPGETPVDDSYQVSFRLPIEIFERIHKSAVAEGIKPGPYVQKMVLVFEQLRPV
jgi:hypothetical protein